MRSRTPAAIPMAILATACWITPPPQQAQQPQPPAHWQAGPEDTTGARIQVPPGGWVASQPTAQPGETRRADYVAPPSATPTTAPPVTEPSLNPYAASSASEGPAAEPVVGPDSGREVTEGGANGTADEPAGSLDATGDDSAAAIPGDRAGSGPSREEHGLAQARRRGRALEDDPDDPARQAFCAANDRAIEEVTILDMTSEDDVAMHPVASFARIVAPEQPGSPTNTIALRADLAIHWWAETTYGEDSGDYVVGVSPPEEAPEEYVSFFAALDRLADLAAIQRKCLWPERHPRQAFRVARVLLVTGENGRPWWGSRFWHRVIRFSGPRWWEHIEARAEGGWRRP